MATSTELDPRRTFTSTRFRTSRYPGFFTRGVDTTGNIEEIAAAQPATAPVSGLRGVGIGNFGGTDGPAPGGGGKQYGDMTPEELSQEARNRGLAEEMFGVGVPQDIEGAAKKGIGLAINGVLPPFAALVNLANRAGREDFAQAVERQSIGNYPGSPSRPDPNYDGKASPATGGPDLGPTHSPETEQGSIGANPDDNTGTPGATSSPSSTEMGSIGASPDDNAGNQSGGPGAGGGGGGNGGGETGGGTTGGEASGGQEGGGAQGGGGGPGAWHTGGPVVGPNPMMRGEEVGGKLLEGENVNDQATVAFWGQEVFDAMAAVAHGQATPDQVKLLLTAIRGGAMESMPQSRPNPMMGSPSGSPLRAVGMGG